MAPLTPEGLVSVIQEFGPAIGGLTLIVVTYAIVDLAVRLFRKA